MKNIIFLSFLFAFSTIQAQSIQQPRAGMGNYTLKPGETLHFYDDGGANMNYTPGVSSIMSIYPSKPGYYVSVTCNYFEMNSDCRMYIFDGNHGGADILKYVHTRSAARERNIVMGDEIIASSENASGALSFRFTNISRLNSKRGWDFTVKLVKSPGPAPTKSTQDCSGAIKVCDDKALTTKANHYGIQELPGPGYWNSLLNYGRDGENQSNWYKFEVKTAGTIEFLIRPHSQTDFDWALWGPYASHQCPPWTTDKPLRASACDGDNSQITGLSVDAEDLTENSWGNGYVKAIDVKAGEHYTIMIDDWEGNNTTFDLFWKMTKGASLECKEDVEPPVTPPKDTSVVVKVEDPCMYAVKIKGEVEPVTSDVLGGVNLEVEGGTPPYSFLWKNVEGKLLTREEDLFGVEGGKYSVEVTDSEGCKSVEIYKIKVESAFEGMEDDGPELKAELSQDEAFVTVSYPGAFEYKIENKNDETVITGHSVNEDVVEITKLPPGEYRVSLIYKKIKQYTTFVKK